MVNSRNKLKCHNEGRKILAKLVVSILAIAIVALVFSEGCATTAYRPNNRDYNPPIIVKNMTVTGYCNCGSCCSWRYTWYGKPVITSGKAKGKTKKVGITAMGTRARMGTIAADTTIYPFGTIIEVPGYGFGRVEDRGGAIKGQHIDLWYPRHKKALEWGKKTIPVRIWIPKKK